MSFDSLHVRIIENYHVSHKAFALMRLFLCVRMVCISSITDSRNINIVMVHEVSASIYDSFIFRQIFPQKS